MFSTQGGAYIRNIKNNMRATLEGLKVVLSR